MPRNRYTKRSRQPVGNQQRCNDPSNQPRLPLLKVTTLQTDAVGEETIIGFDQGVVPSGPLTLRDGAVIEDTYVFTMEPVDPVTNNVPYRTFRLTPYDVKVAPGTNWLFLRSDNPNLRSVTGQTLDSGFIGVTAL